MEKIGGVLTDRIEARPLGDVVTRHVVFAIDAAQFATGPLAGGA